MTNETNEQRREGKQRKSLLRDLEEVVWEGPLSGIFGMACSWFDPMAVPKALRNIRNVGINSISQYVGTTAFLAGYGYAMQVNIRDFIDDPTEPRNYLFLAANALSGAIQGGVALYKAGRRSAESQPSTQNNSQNGDDKMKGGKRE